VTAVPFIPDLHWTPDFNGRADKWSGFELDRTQILNALYENRVNNVFFLAGDIHASAEVTMTWKRDMNTYQLHSVVSSPLRHNLRLPGFLIDKNKSLNEGLPTEFRYQTHFTYSWENKYGLARVTQNLSRVTYEVYDDDGNQQTSYVFNL
jgi:phosphodiesterase/alkaline phosphatase D-like protein